MASEREIILKLLCDKGGKLNVLKTLSDEQLAEVESLVQTAQDLLRGEQRRPAPPEEVNRAAQGNGAEKMSEERRQEFQRDLLALDNADFATKYPVRRARASPTS